MVKMRAMISAVLLLAGILCMTHPFRRDVGSTVLTFNRVPFTAFLFQSCHTHLADMQVALFRRFLPHGSKLIVVFDCKDWHSLSAKLPLFTWRALGVHTVVPSEDDYKDMNLDDNSVPSWRHSAIATWTFQKFGVPALRRHSAVGLFDGDIFPITPYVDPFVDEDGKRQPFVCARHPNPQLEYCFLGLIHLHPDLLLETNVTNLHFRPDFPNDYDSGGGSALFFKQNPQLQHGWFRQTVVTAPGFANGVFDGDILWAKAQFAQLNDKSQCGSQVFHRGRKDMYYHMLSATSEWRFRNATLNSIRISQMKKAVDRLLNAADIFYPLSGYAQYVFPWGNFTCTQNFKTSGSS